MKISTGLCPFWFWNGEMADEAIRDQIRMMHEAKIGGFMIQARQGLTIPYLSRQWFDKVAVAVSAAKQWGLDVWLCDEYPYPSGNAGGEVLLEHPEYAAVQLEVIRRDLSGPQDVSLDLPWGEPVWAAAYPVYHGVVDWEHPVNLEAEIGIISPDKIFQLSGLTPYNRKRFFSGHPQKQLHWAVPRGEWRIYLFMQVAMAHQKFFGQFIDSLNKKAVECFIRVTHEKYREYLGAEFGKTIKGFFVDEIEPQPHEGEIRWSALLPELFFRRKGYSLLPNLPALVEPVGKDTAKIRYDYWDVLTQAFIDTFDKPVAAWCHANGLLYAGEKPILRSSQLQYFDVPGIDAGHQKVNSIPAIASAKYRANAKLLGSAAHFYGKPRALCECFHSVGWGMTLQDMRWMIDWIAIQGVNLLVPHAFFYTTNGLAKHDAPPSSFYQNPAWLQTSILSCHVETLCELGTDCRQEVHILVIDPVTSRWTAMGEKRAVKERLAEDFAQLQQILLREHFDFFIIDPQKLAEGRVEGDQLVIGAERFSSVILPPMLNLEAMAWKRVKEFVEAGGRVFGIKCLPIEEIGGEDDMAAFFSTWFGIDAVQRYQNYCDQGQEKIWHDDGRGDMPVLVNEINDLPGILEKYEPRMISITSADCENDAILVNHYLKDDTLFIFVLNTSGSWQEAQITCAQSNFADHAYEIVMENPKGRRREVASELMSNRVVFQTEFAPYQSRLYELTRFKKDAEVYLPRESRGDIIWLDAVEPWDLAVSANYLRLDQWQLRIEEINGTPSEDPRGAIEMVRCQPLINQIAGSGMHLPVLLADYFGCPPEMTFPGLTCRYRTEWHVEAMPRNIWLVMETGAIGGDWEMILNGKVLVRETFRRKPFYDLNNDGVLITPFLKQGLNCLEVKVWATRMDDGLLNPLYLCGDFGVFRMESGTGWKLTSLPTKGLLQQPAQSGIPFYAGTIRYSRRMALNPAMAPLRIGITDIEDPVELLLNGATVGVRAWEPFIWKLPAERVKLGENLIELKVSTTLLGLYEGSYFDPESHCYREY